MRNVTGSFFVSFLMWNMILEKIVIVGVLLIVCLYSYSLFYFLKVTVYFCFLSSGILVFVLEY